MYFLLEMSTMSEDIWVYVIRNVYTGWYAIRTNKGQWIWCLQRCHAAVWISADAARTVGRQQFRTEPHRIEPVLIQPEDVPQDRPS